MFYNFFLLSSFIIKIKNNNYFKIYKNYKNFKVMFENISSSENGLAVLKYILGPNIFEGHSKI